MKIRQVWGGLGTVTSLSARNCKELMNALWCCPGSGPHPTNGLMTFGTLQQKSSIASAALLGSLYAWANFFRSALCTRVPKVSLLETARKPERIFLVAKA